MNTEVRYTMFRPYAGSNLEDFKDPASVNSRLVNSVYELEEWIVTTAYQDGTTDSLNGRMWRNRYLDRQKTPQAPMPPFHSEAPQQELVAALDRYNSRYDNSAYLNAVHSLREIEDTPDFIQQAIRIQDVALYLCGAQNLPCVSPTRITRQMVLFWMDFARDQQDDEPLADLPF